MHPIRTHKHALIPRRILSVLLAGLLALSALALLVPLPASAAREAPTVPVYLDGREILAGDCVLYEEVTYVPLRKFCNLFDDCTFTWNGSTSTATVKTASGLTVIARTGALYIYANGHYFYTVGKIQNWDGSLYIPIRPLAKAFDLPLTWNAAGRHVELSSPKGAPAVAPASYKSDEVYWLSRIISAEAGGESFLGQLAVGNVVLNRKTSPLYPNTIYGVIFDRKYGTQFSPVSMGTIYNTPTASSVIAAKIALEGYSLSEDILFFLNPRISTSFWIVHNRAFAFRIGNHDFYE